MNKKALKKLRGLSYLFPVSVLHRKKKGKPRNEQRQIAQKSQLNEAKRFYYSMAHPDRGKFNSMNRRDCVVRVRQYLNC